MPKVSPVTIETIDDLARYGHTLALNCVPCHRWVDLDLAKMQAAGRGQQSFVEMKFRCSECGGKADKQLRSPLAWKDGDNPFAASPSY